MANCPKCGGEIKENAKFCRHCGNKIEQEPQFVFCEECGAKIEANAPFCEECGAKIDGAPAQNDDPWANFADNKQPECIVAEKVVEKVAKVEKQAPVQQNDTLQKGLDLFDANDFDGALKCLLSTKQAKIDHEVQFKIGKCYHRLQDYPNSCKWYEIAIDSGSIKAAVNLGNIYKAGKGVTKDEQYAAELYTKAANGGSRVAQCNLAICYENGYGVKQDIKQAIKWYKLSAEQGYADAQYVLGWSYVTGNGVSANLSDGIYWYQQAAQQNHCHSQYELGWHYENGKGVKKDKAQAIKYYKLAAQNGSAKAKERLEKIN
ncbi:MAG: SEL1-like repeat protein [Clostridia bacterium]|nr:SEL1-like repeat protein [Clostridia bacterium]